MRASLHFIAAFLLATPTLHAFVDANADGIPDVWAARYPEAGPAEADPDGDGQLNLQESLAGTNPFDAASRFVAATPFTDSAGDLRLSWSGTAGTRYRIDSSPDLASWELGTETLAATDSPRLIRPAGVPADPRRFWRVVVLPPNTELTLAYALPTLVEGIEIGTLPALTSGETPGAAATFTLVTGTLPPGLSLRADGALVGTPQQAGSFTFAVRAASGPRSAETTFRALVAPWPGETMWRQPLASDPLANQPAGIAWTPAGPGGEPCLEIVRDTTGSAAMAKIPVDLTAYRGMRVSLEALVRAEGVTQPAGFGNGVKCMLTFFAPGSGRRGFINLLGPGEGRNVYGTFDWTRLASDPFTIPADATEGFLHVGFQDCRGSAWVKDIGLRLWRPAVDEFAPLPPRGHAPLRGVMTPWIYRPADFAELDRWNVNIVRWHFGPSDTAALTMSPTEYTAYIDAQLPMLDAMLADAAARGIKVLLDLHGFPGGRNPDESNPIFEDVALQDLLVSTWEELARRYRGHPAVFAYGVMNEPAHPDRLPPGVLDVVDFQARVARAIRAIDTATPITVQIGWRGLLRPPIRVPGLLYEFHIYSPAAYTHQGLAGRPLGLAYGATDPSDGLPLTQAGLRARVASIRSYQQAFRVPVFVGEFSAVRWAPGAADYLRDAIALFEEYGWDWCFHAFREAYCWDPEMEALPADPNVGIRSVTPTDRMQVIRAWFEQNTRP